MGVHFLALMISTCSLPLLQAGNLFASHEDRIARIYIRLAWILSTGFGEELFCFEKFKLYYLSNLGIFLFLLEVVVVCWIKFFFVTYLAAIAVTVIVVSVIISFSIFSIHFYQRLAILKLSHHQNELGQIENRIMNLKSSTINIICFRQNVLYFLLR